VVPSSAETGGDLQAAGVVPSSPAEARENSRGGAAAKVAATAVIPIATSTIDHINASTNEHYGAGR
jgi:hypothetical protein